METYVGTIGLPGGRQGTVLLRKSPSALAAVRPGRRHLLSALFGLIEASLQAQGSAASGELILPDSVVKLSGSYNGNTFNVAGSGYTLTASVSEGSLSGSGTSPEGSGITISPPAPLIVDGGAAAPNASGLYTGSYSITAPSFLTNTRSDGSVVSCSFNTLITGTLNLDLTSTAAGTYNARLFDRWTESEGSGGTCASAVLQTVSPSGPLVAEAVVSAGALQMGWVDNYTPPQGGVLSRTLTLVGAVSGSTVVARISRSMVWSPHPCCGGLISTYGHAPTSVGVTLVK